MPDSFPCRHVTLYSTNGKGTEVKQVVHTHQTSYGAVGGESLVHLISILTFEYLLPVQWLSVLAPTHLLPLRPEHPFTLRRRMAKHTKITVSCVWTTVLSGMVFVWAQELSGIGIVWKWRQSVIDFFSFCCRRWLGYWKIVLVETVEQLCSLLFHHLLLVTMRRWTRWDSQIKLKI